MPEILNIPALFARISNVRLHGGVVGKVTRVLMMACAAIAVIAWSVHLWWIALLGLMIIFALCFPLLWRLINFADRNPQAALFEGAEFLAHEHLQLGTKARPDLSASVLTPQPAPEPELPISESSSDPRLPEASDSSSTQPEA